MNPASTEYLRVDDAHPSLPGHFPGMPVVPGVVLMNCLLAQLQQDFPALKVAGVRKLKFLRMVMPGEAFNIEFSPPGANDLRFKGWRDGEKIFEGNLALRPVAGMA